MYLIKDEMWGIKILYDGNNKIVLVFFLCVSGIVIVGGVVMMCMIFDYKVLLSVVVVVGVVGGLFVFVLLIFEVLDDF